MQYGVVFIEDYEYPFCYDDVKEKITLYLGDNNIINLDGVDEIVGQKLGKMAGGYILYKLDAPLSNNTMTVVGDELKPVISGNQIRSVDYYIENFYYGALYTEMKLRFPELDYFIQSVNRIAISKESFVFSRESESLYCFEIQYADTKVIVSFDIKAEVHINTRGYAETVSEVSLKFPKTRDMDYLTELYYRVRAFFCFICNRQNIGLRSASLIGERLLQPSREGKKEDITRKVEQHIFFSQKYLELQEDEKQIKNVAPSGLFSDKLKELLQLFFEKKSVDVPLVNCGSVHRSFKYRNYIDLGHSLNLTATFEFYMRTMLPKISSEKSDEFCNDIQSLLDDYIKGKTGDLRKKAKYLKNHLLPPISLEEKIKKAYCGYSTWKPLNPVLSEWFGEDISELAYEANQWRNELAHEKRDYIPEENTILAVRLVEHLNYCIVLRKAGYNDEQIKSIVAVVLTR